MNPSQQAYCIKSYLSSLPLALWGGSHVTLIDVELSTTTTGVLTPEGLAGLVRTDVQLEKVSPPTVKH